MVKAKAYFLLDLTINLASFKNQINYHIKIKIFPFRKVQFFSGIGVGRFPKPSL
jgi:hypothetical protein